MPQGFPYKRLIAEIIPFALLELTAELAASNGTIDPVEAEAVMALGVTIDRGYRGSSLPDLDGQSLPLYRGIARRARVHIGWAIIAGVYDIAETEEAARFIREIAALERHLQELERTLD